MTTAQSIFVVYGVVILAYGFVLGVPLAASRMKAPQASKHLVTTHLSAIIQGAVHLVWLLQSDSPISPPAGLWQLLGSSSRGQASK